MISSLTEANKQIQQQKRRINEQESDLSQYRNQVEQLLAHIEKQAHENALMKHQIEQLLRRLYGARSERFNPDQLLLDGIIEKLPEVFPEPEKVEVRHIQKKRQAKPTGRIEIPEHLEVETVLLDVPAEQKKDPATGEDLVHIRDEISKRLAYKPARLFAIHYVRPVYAPRSKESDGPIITADLPEGILDKCKADESLIAHLIISKYQDHLPLYRQSEIFKREGVHIARSTLCGWTVESLLSLELLYETLRHEILSHPVLYTDDTPVQLLKPGHGKTKTGRMWVYVAGLGPPYRIYDFTEDRKKRHPIDFLGDYAGYVHADAYSGYDELFGRPGITEVACWAHARRKFDEALKTAPEPCSRILALIGMLYAVERQGKESALNAESLADLRRKESAPVLDRLFSELNALQKSALPQSPLGKAVTYALNQETALRIYAQDGRLSIDNNTAENALRPLALGRKNWLFAGSDRGGKACAIALSLLQSAKACGLNEHHYLTDILRRYRSHSVMRLSELLPANWKPLEGNPIP